MLSGPWESESYLDVIVLILFVFVVVAQAMSQDEFMSPESRLFKEYHACQSIPG